PRGRSIAARRPLRRTGRGIRSARARPGPRRRRAGGDGARSRLRRAFRVGFRIGLAAGIACLAACATRRSPAPAAAPPAGSGSSEEGVASWYGGPDGFEGKPTASGEIYDGNQLTAAHRTLPLGTLVDVQNLENGKTLRVRINDRGPFVKGRIVDLSRAAARELGVIGPGTASVRLTVVAPGVEPTPVSPSGL